MAQENKESQRLSVVNKELDFTRLIDQASQLLTTDRKYCSRGGNIIITGAHVTR
jgi:hypothetical protein